MIRILGVNLYLYGLIIGVAIWTAYVIATKAAKIRKVPEKVVDEALYWVVIWGVVGARAYHVIDYWKEYYSDNIYKIFFLWEGGLGIWGALIGGIVGLGIFWRTRKVRLMFLKICDVAVVGIPLAQAIGRLGNMVNREVYGKNGEPLFFYEGICNLLLFLLLWRLRGIKGDGRLTGVYFVGYGVTRAILENMRAEPDIWRVASFPTAVAVGIISIAVGAFLIWRKQPSQPRP